MKPNSKWATLINRNGSLATKRIYPEEEARKLAADKGKMVALLSLSLPEDVTPSGYRRIQMALRSRGIKILSYKGRFDRAWIPFGTWPALDERAKKELKTKVGLPSEIKATHVYLTFDNRGCWSIGTGRLSDSGSGGSYSQGDTYKEQEEVLSLLGLS